MCGPTASGKSAAADELAERLSLASGAPATTIIVDSMQVYREIPRISNQARRRPAELVGSVSVTEEWTVARHRAAVDALISTRSPSLGVGGPAPSFVLDAGTGMYLNTILMDIDIAPKVDPSLRAEAARQAAVSAGDTSQRFASDDGGERANPRRRARSRELELAGAPARGSIWRPETRMDADILYLRPPRDAIDASIARRSRKIARDGVDEARHLMEMSRQGRPPTLQVMGSIGVRELIEVLERRDDEADTGSAVEGISARTRRLARRQVRWFDKMVRTLDRSVRITVADGPNDPRAAAFIERAVEDRLREPHGTMG